MRCGIFVNFLDWCSNDTLLFSSPFAQSLIGKEKSLNTPSDISLGGYITPRPIKPGIQHLKVAQTGQRTP
jgi:hypothetical protein